MTGDESPFPTPEGTRVSARHHDEAHAIAWVGNVQISGSRAAPRARARAKVGQAGE